MKRLRQLWKMHRFLKAFETWLLEYGVKKFPIDAKQLLGHIKIRLAGMGFRLDLQATRED